MRQFLDRASMSFAAGAFGGLDCNRNAPSPEPLRHRRRPAHQTPSTAPLPPSKPPSIPQAVDIRVSRTAMALAEVEEGGFTGRPPGATGKRLPRPSSAYPCPAGPYAVGTTLQCWRYRISSLPTVCETTRSALRRPERRLDPDVPDFRLIPNRCSSLISPSVKSA